jgi:hypothetical protein
MTDETNPFTAFERILEQFGPSGGAGPGAGIPMVPLPLPSGAGAGTPADTTKRTLTQLYRTLDAFSADPTGGPAVDAWKRYADAFDVETTMGPERATAMAVTTYRLWFHGLAQVLVESYTLRLLDRRLVSASHRGTAGTQQWLWGLGQPTREQLLLRCTEVDDDLITEMETARQHRDKLLYNFDSWDELDVESSLDDARRYLDILTALDDLVTEGSPFSFYPAGAGAGGSTEEN